MTYTLYDDFITLQALLKDTGVIQSGGAAKAFLATQTVLLNGEREDRRGKKVRVGDCISLPERDLTITVVAPTETERQAHEDAKAEKARVAALVKKLNQDTKKATANKANPKKSKAKTELKTKGRQPVRFPGT